MTDTSTEAAALQADLHRRMSGEQRLRIAMEMSDLARELTLARLRLDHPAWGEPELRRELLRYAFGPDPLPPPLR